METWKSTGSIAQSVAMASNMSLAPLSKQGWQRTIRRRGATQWRPWGGGGVRVRGVEAASSGDPEEEPAVATRALSPVALRLPRRRRPKPILGGPANLVGLVLRPIVENTHAWVATEVL